MDKSEVRAAVGEAFKDQVKLLYKVAVQNSIDGSDPTERFMNGVELAHNVRELILKGLK